MEPAPDISDQDLLRVVQFHGHICPGLAYGFRVAKAAMRELRDRSSDEEIVAVVENDSCAVDAVQVITGCTFGKGNLIFRDTGKQVYTFLNRNTERGVRIRVEFTDEETPEESDIWRRFREGDRQPETLASVSRLRDRKISRILEMPEEELLRSTSSEASLPPRAKIFPSVKCSHCGEKMMESRARVKQGRIVCIPCSEETGQ